MIQIVFDIVMKHIYEHGIKILDDQKE